MKSRILIKVSFSITALISAFQLSALEAPNQITTKVLIEPSAKSVQFFKSQVEGSSGIAAALNNLLDRYPQKTPEFVALALSAYPERYSEIITTSISAQPMFVDEIIMVAHDYKVASAVEIVQIAVNAEPSYAAMATSAACKYSPEQFNEIVRSAVTAEPDSADQIAQLLVSAFPSKTMEILITTIKEVPYVGKYVLDALLATVANDEGKSKDMIIISVEQLAKYPDAIERLVELASDRAISADRIKQSAIRGGLSEDAIVAVINEHYDVDEL